MINGQFTHFKLIVRDLERSLAFYALFGQKVSAVLDFIDPAATEVMLENSAGERTLVLLHGEVLPPPAPIPGYAPLVYAVDDVHAAASQLESAGYELKVEPTEFGPVTVAMVADPDGYLVELVAGDADAVQSPPPGTKIPHPMPQIHHA
ncbi:VOC family protein [Nocardia sp. NPDC050717]|uniref:VOC family protein n=1 Tax=Nocardia sp. NPDC050717 TaxID=3157221 RepID=UPI0033E3F503